MYKTAMSAMAMMNGLERELAFIADNCQYASSSHSAHERGRLCAERFWRTVVTLTAEDFETVGQLTAAKMCKAKKTQETFMVGWHAYRCTPTFAHNPFALGQHVNLYLAIMNVGPKDELNTLETEMYHIFSAYVNVTHLETTTQCIKYKARQVSLGLLNRPDTIKFLSKRLVNYHLEVGGNK